LSAAIEGRILRPAANEGAEKAIGALNGKDLKGRTLTVKEERARADRFSLLAFACLLETIFFILRTGRFVIS
jgi:hypothetical protein